MPHVEIQGKNHEITDAGFLVEREGWTEELAAALADLAGVELTPAHWEIVSFIRDYYFRYHHLPNNRLFVKAIRKRLGNEKGNTHYLYSLFPEAPLKHACQIAGLPKPTSCI